LRERHAIVLPAIFPFDAGQYPEGGGCVSTRKNATYNSPAVMRGCLIQALGVRQSARIKLIIERPEELQDAIQRIIVETCVERQVELPVLVSECLPARRLAFHGENQGLQSAERRLRHLWKGARQHGAFQCLPQHQQFTQPPLRWLGDGKQGLKQIAEVKKMIYKPAPMPEVRDDDVLINMKVCGICRSDVHFHEHGEPAFPDVYPFILGHEGAGQVVKVGRAVKTLSVGDRVAIEPGTPCRHCEWCVTGRYNLCANMIFKSAPREHGIMREFDSHPAQKGDLAKIGHMSVIGAGRDRLAGPIVEYMDISMSLGKLDG
jgi:hypothetical protein